MEAAVHHTVVVVHMAGVATAAHSVGVVVVVVVVGVVVLVVVRTDHTLVIGINHRLESFLKVNFTNHQSTFVAKYWVFNRVYSRHVCWWTSERWTSSLL